MQNGKPGSECEVAVANQVWDEPYNSKTDVVGQDHTRNIDHAIRNERSRYGDARDPAGKDGGKHPLIQRPKSIESQR